MPIRKRTITLSDEEWDALRRLAAASGITRHAFFRRMAQAASRKFPVDESPGSATDERLESE